jgi:hypothetical protein
MSVALAPAWAQIIDGKTYAVRRIGSSSYEVRRDGQNLGSFEFRLHTPRGPVADVHAGAKARAVAWADHFTRAWHSDTSIHDRWLTEPLL